MVSTTVLWENEDGEIQINNYLINKMICTTSHARNGTLADNDMQRWEDHDVQLCNGNKISRDHDV